MKRMLLSVLLFAASVIMAQAQGFRVHRSDGAVYEFSVVADSIVFFDGEGDPNYQEPVPDYVLDAINQLQAYCDNLKAACAENQANSQNNAGEIMYLTCQIKDLICQLYDLEHKLEKVSDKCDANFNAAKAYVDTEIANLKSSVLSNISSVHAAIINNSNEISKLEADLQISLAKVSQTLADINTQSDINSDRISKLEAQIEYTYARVTALEGNFVNFEDDLRLLVERDAEKDAMIKALSERIAALEAKVNQ